MQPIPAALLVAATAIAVWSWALVARRRERLAADRRLELLLHQLKNPIQSILLHTDLLRDATAAGSTESRAEICGAILTEAQRLSKLIADFSASPPGRDVVPGSAGPTRRMGNPA